MLDAAVSPITAATVLDWIKAVGTVFAACSLYLTYRSLRANIRWNRLNATVMYLPGAVYLERERAAADALETIGVDLYKQVHPLPDDKVAAILDESKVFREVKDFLNLFEDYAAAYKAHCIDPDQSFLLCGSQFIVHFTIFRPLILATRLKRANTKAWSEFEWLVLTVWRPKKDAMAVAEQSHARAGVFG